VLQWVKKEVMKLGGWDVRGLGFAWGG
jgi:hypothetical protein